MLLLLLSACTSVEPAERVFTNGIVLTMDGGSAEAVAVRQGRIQFVGTEIQVDAYISASTIVEDLRGGALLPGFVDAHMHLAWGGVDLQLIDLYAVATLEQLQAVVATYSASHPEEEWLQGSGWDPSVFEGRMDRSLLDVVVADRPVYLLSADGHSAWLNSAALQAAGIDAETEAPEGGIVEMGADGQPNGVLREDAMELVDEVLPPHSDAITDIGITKASAMASEMGITTIVDANTDEAVLAGYHRADEAGKLSVRVHAAVEADPAEGADQIADIVVMRNDYLSERLHVEGVKFYLDGVIESGTAYLVDPYEDGSNGEALFSDARLDELFRATDDVGLQIHVHAIGDGAVRQLLDGLERLNQQRGWADRRPLAAHIELIQPTDLPRFEELGVYADFQPLWAYPDSYITDLTIPVIGQDRAAWLYPIGDMAASGAILVAGSDWNVSSMNPFEAMEVAITREDPLAPGEILNPDQRIDLPTILAAYTRDGAKAVFQEDQLGSITAGKIADLVVVDRDPFAVEISELSELKVQATFLAGEPVYRRQQ